MGVKTKKLLILIFLLIICSMFLACDDKKNTSAINTMNTQKSTNMKSINNSNTVNSNSKTMKPSTQNSKAQAQFYRTQANLMESKIKSQERSVAFAKENVRKNPSSASAAMMYNSADQLLQTYIKQKDQYLRLASQAESMH